MVMEFVDELARIDWEQVAVPLDHRARSTVDLGEAMQRARYRIAGVVAQQKLRARARAAAERPGR